MVSETQQTVPSSFSSPNTNVPLKSVVIVRHRTLVLSLQCMCQWHNPVIVGPGLLLPELDARRRSLNSKNVNTALTTPDPRSISQRIHQSHLGGDAIYEGISWLLHGCETRKELSREVTLSLSLAGFPRCTALSYRGIS